MHHYYEIHITHRHQLLYKRHYNTKLFELNKILEDLNTYDYNEIQYILNMRNISKEEFEEKTNVIKVFSQEEYIKYLFMKKQS